MKNENGRRAAAARLTLKPLIMSGTIGPSMFVSSDMTKNTTKTNATMERFRVMEKGVPTVTCVLLGNSHFCGQLESARLALGIRRQSQGNHLYRHDFQDRSNTCSRIRKAER